MGMTPHGGHRLSSQTCWGWGCGERSYHQSFFQGLILAILIWFCVRDGASLGQESVLCSILSFMFNIVSVSHWARLGQSDQGSRARRTS